MKSPVTKSSVRLFLRTRQTTQDQEANLYHWERDRHGDHLDATILNPALRGLSPARPKSTLRLRIG